MKKNRVINIIIAAAVMASSFFICGCENKTVAAVAGDSGVKLPVVMYHSIVDSDERASKYVVKPSIVEQDFTWLRDNGYTSVSAAQLLDYVYGTGDLPDKPVLITLDDGFFNNLSYLPPLLEKYDFHAVVSVVGAFTAKESDACPKQSNIYSYLRWDQINELCGMGRVEIGNHTYNMHGSGGRQGVVRASGESDGEYYGSLQRDIEKLQQKLREKCGSVPAIFTYPYGTETDIAREVVSDMGFRVTLTCREYVNMIERGKDCLLELGRYNRPTGVSSEKFFGAMTKLR